MASKPNPFAHLMPKLMSSAPSTTVRTPEEKKAEYAEHYKMATQLSPLPGEKNISESEKRDLTNPQDSDNDLSMTSNEKETTKQLTPQAQLLMGANGEAPVFEPMPLGESHAPSTTQELAMIDTSNEDVFEPKTEIQKNINVTSQNMAKQMVLKSESEVRDLCDRIDGLIEKATGPQGIVQIVGPSLGEIRNYVQSLMITLKSRPEFDSVLIAKDIRNVMQFIRSTREETLALREVKTEKKAVRAVKKEAKGKSLKGFESAFNSVMFKFPGS